jgi:predicted metal-dependent hydrolase
MLAGGDVGLLVAHHPRLHGMAYHIRRMPLDYAQDKQLRLPLSESSPSHIEIPDTPTAVSGVVSPGALPPLSITFTRRRRARRYVLRVDGEGGVRVTIPRGGSKREADEFVARHRAWIDRQRVQIRPPGLSLPERRALRQRAAIELPARLLTLAATFGLSVSRISIRNQRTRWGSCGRNGHITLNWRLVTMPEWVADYVIVHELMHLRRLDHSPAYWKLVAAAYPRYREARQWLRANAERLR